MFAVNSAVLTAQCQVLIKPSMKTIGRREILESCQLAAASADASARPKLFGPRTGPPFSPHFLARVYTPSQRRRRQYHDQGPEIVRGRWDFQIMGL